MTATVPPAKAPFNALHSRCVTHHVPQHKTHTNHRIAEATGSLTQTLLCSIVIISF